MSLAERVVGMRVCAAVTLLLPLSLTPGCLSSNAISDQDAQSHVDAATGSEATATTSTGRPAADSTGPPMRLDESRRSGGRAATPIATPNDKDIVCRVEYGDGLTSQMTVDVETHAPLYEEFPLWTVVFDYRDSEDEEARVPTSFTIHKNNAGERGDQIAEYKLAEIDPGGQNVRYLDPAGRFRLVPKAYFNIDRALTIKEPPMKLCVEKAGAVRYCAPLAPPTGQEQYLTFRVRYHQYGFESRAVVEVETGAPLREVFPFWWQVVYEYATEADREARVPTSFTVFRNVAYDTRGEQINRHEKMFVDPGGESVHYKDLAGNEKEVETSYFSIMPDVPTGSQ
jgi:hypothetical protein